MSTEFFMLSVFIRVQKIRLRPQAALEKYPETIA
jgi:hypothetical protein